MSDARGADWEGYYVWSAGRPVRPLLLEALRLFQGGTGGEAVDLGCGDGTESLALLERGWSVLAVDADPDGLSRLGDRVPIDLRQQLRIVHASFVDLVLPPADLVFAGFSLPFCPPSGFGPLWARVRAALRPGAVFAGQLFGDRDSWAADKGMTFHSRAEVEALVEGLDVLALHEEERDGVAFSGPKHWHVHDLIARRVD